MSKHNQTFKLVAYTDAAGKYDAEAYRCGNEDNFYVDDNLSDDLISHCNPDQPTTLSELGMLMVVADGMGGMNAGEVASQIAIDTVKTFFSPNKLSMEIAQSHAKRAEYLEKTIKAADKNIKEEAHHNPEHQGMGSTIIMAWLWNNELTISWCGDSRAYIFNQRTGIQLISEDHSYVQELVNKGLITYEQTFDHPQNNIVTRSLGDPQKEARPESRCFYVAKGDIILLCSDGLSGVLRDKKTYDSKGNLLCEDNLEDILRVNDTSMKECREALWRAAERAGWYDNVTAILCKIDNDDERTCAPQPTTKTSVLRRRIPMGYLLLTIPLVVVLTLVTQHLTTSNDFFHPGNTEELLMCNDTLQTKNNETVEDSIKEEKKEKTSRQPTDQKKVVKTTPPKVEKETPSHEKKERKPEEDNKTDDSKKGNESIQELTIVKDTSSTKKESKLTKVKRPTEGLSQQPTDTKKESSTTKQKSNPNHK